MRYLFLILSTTIALLSCNSGSPSKHQESYSKKIPPPKLQPLQDPSLKHLAIEQPDPSDSSDERYNKDNIIYRVGRSFYFNFEYKDKTGKKLWAKVKDYTHFDRYGIVSQGPPANNYITGFRAVVQPGRKPFSDLDRNFNKSVLAYEYLMPNGVFDRVALTMLVENNKNIWLIPPRDFLFKVLELSPYPYVKFPLDTINKWTYRKTISDKWGDDRWMHWKGRTNAGFTYYNKGRRLAKHPFLGEIQVYLIHAIGAVKGMTSSVDFLFSKKYGFVQMNYLNVDSSRISIVMFKAEK